MRIGFTGAGGTGKSTLANLIATPLKLTFVQGVSRGVFAELGLTEVQQRGMTPAERWKIQETILERKFLQESQTMADDVVFDRTPIDHLAYCMFRCEEALTKKRLEDMEFLTRVSMGNYDSVFYTPIAPWYSDKSDGLRESSFVYQSLIDLLIRGYLDKMHVTYVTMPDEGSPEQLAKMILRYVEIKGKDLAAKPSG